MDDNVAPAFAITILLVVGAEKALGVDLNTYFSSSMIHPSAVEGSYDPGKVVQFVLPFIFQAAKSRDPGYKRRR